MGKVVCIMNQKGGVGKTTTTFNLGIGLGVLGKKILIIDLDPQASLTVAFGFNQKEINKSSYDFLMNKCSFNEVVISCKGVDLIPATVELSEIDVEVSSKKGRETLLKNSISNLINNYDYILIDCPPNLGILSVNALNGSDGVLIPMNGEYLALEGLSLLSETIEIVKKRLNLKLKIVGIVMNKFDKRKKLHNEVYEIIKDCFKDDVFDTYIRNNIALAESPSFGKDIYEYSSRSAGAVDYKKLCEEFISRV